MRNTLFVGVCCLLFAASVSAQSGKPWTEWSQKDADKILNGSPWAQSQMRGEAPPSLTVPNGGGTQATRQGPAPLPQEVFVRARFLSAKPVREGFASRLRHSHPDPPVDLDKELQTIIDNGFGEFIIVAVNVDGRNPATVAATLQGLRRLDVSQLENKVYLERKDGKRLSVIDYKVPIADNMGGKFVFARSMDGEPFLDPKSGSVKFVMNLSENLRVNMKFDVAKMMYNGKLEY